MTKNGSIRVPGVIATDDARAATGAIVYWQLAQRSIPADALAARWAEDGLTVDEHGRPCDPPSGASEGKALRRAVRRQAGRHVFSRRIGRGDFSLVDERDPRLDDVDPEYAVRLRARLSTDGDGNAQLEIRSNDESARQAVREAFVGELGQVAPRDLSSWLSGRLVPELQAVALRDAGGFYYVPARHMDRYRRVAAVLADMGGHRLYEVPAMQTEETVRAVLDAVTSEVDARLGAVEEELMDGQLKARALASRAQLLGEMRGKLSVYEEQLGVRLQNLRDRVSRVDEAVALAALSHAAAVEDEERAMNGGAP